MNQPVFVELYASSRTGLRAQAVAGVEEVRRRGARVLALGLDNLPALDDTVLAATIVALRRLREVGGAVYLVTQSVDHRSRLALTGLDRVFEVVATADDADRLGDRGRFTLLPQQVAATIARSVAEGLLVASLMLGTVAAQEDPAVAIADPQAHAIVSQLIERDPALQSFEADVHVDVAMRSFPYVHARLAGKTYYKRPDRYEVVFARVPRYAKGLEHLYADIGDPSTWNRTFIITADGERSTAGHRELALRLVKRVRGMVHHEEVFVDPVTWLVDEMDYVYYNGGRIEVQQRFAPSGGFTLLQSQRATITIPHFHAVATSTFDSFRTNVAIDDTIFVKNGWVQQ